MQVVLDTNVLLTNLRGARPRNDLKLVLADARTGRFGLVVPELVLQETVNKRRETAQEATRNLRQGQSGLAALDVTIDLPTVDVDAAVEDFKRQLLDLLAASKVDIRALPDVAHEIIVRRALERRKPFAASGAGYRDALVWETVLALTSECNEDVVLLTNNSKDFAEDKTGTRLAPDLVQDLEAVGAVGRVRLVPTLVAFKDEFVALETIAADELDHQLQSESLVRQQLFSALRKQLESHVFDRDGISDRHRNGADLDLPYGTIDATLVGATVRDVEQLHGVWVRSAQSSEDELLVELEAEVDAEVEIEMEVEIEGDPYDLQEPWHRERYHRTAQVSSTKTLLIGAEATYRPADQSLEEIHVYHVSV